MMMQITHSWVCWAILLLALVCYFHLCMSYLSLRQENGSSEHQGINRESNHQFSSVLIGALPLLGLLGTIIGLLDAFAALASEGGSSEMMSASIADALLTTQLGLVCAVPAWLIHAYTRSLERTVYTPQNMLR